MRKANFKIASCVKTTSTHTVNIFFLTKIRIALVVNILSRDHTRVYGILSYVLLETETQNTGRVKISVGSKGCLFWQCYLEI